MEMGKLLFKKKKSLRLSIYSFPFLLLPSLGGVGVFLAVYTARFFFLNLLMFFLQVPVSLSRQYSKELDVHSQGLEQQS